MDAIIRFVTEHSALFAALGVDIINMLIAFIPGFQSNSILHWILQQLIGLAKPKQ